MDTVEFTRELPGQDYSRLAIEPVNTSEAALLPADQNTYEPVVAVLAKTDQTLRSESIQSLQGNLQAAPVSPGGAMTAGALRLRTKVTEIEPGSRAARYWGGFGAGAAWVRVSGEVVDAQKGRTVQRAEEVPLSS